MLVIYLWRHSDAFQQLFKDKEILSIKFCSEQSIKTQSDSEED